MSDSPLLDFSENVNDGMNIKLSICVPTYNRARYLQECLDSIVVASQGLLDEIEMVISDNASTDGTAEVVSSYSKAFPHFQYHQQPTNIGGERNFRAVASLAKGKYVWVFGDDDQMVESAIGEVLRRIKAGHDVLICNYSAWSKDFSVQKIAAALPPKSDQVFTDSNEVMKSFGWNLGYISSVVFMKPLLFKLSAEDYEAYVQYGFPFAYAIYFGILAGVSVSYIAVPIVRNRTNNSGEDYDWYKYFVTGSSLILDALRERGYSRRAVALAKRRVIHQYVIHDILVKKRDGASTKGLLGLMYVHYKMQPMFWLGVVPALLIPGIFVRTIWALRKEIRNHRDDNTNQMIRRDT